MSSIYAALKLICYSLVVEVLPVIGLVLVSAPNVANIFPALKPLLDYKHVGPALATTLAPAMAATLFLCIALGIIHC